MDQTDEGPPTPALSEEKNPYGIYEKLVKQSRQIRLAKLLPGSTDIVRVVLETVSLHDKPQYDALSYVWGDPTVTRDIQVNGHAMPVTANLEAALKQFRYEVNRSLPGSDDHDRIPAVTQASESHLLLWADAICINQHDNDERGDQVALMQYIYRGASRVRAWLGLMPNGVAHAVRRLFDQASGAHIVRGVWHMDASHNQRAAHRLELNSILESGETPDDFTNHLRPLLKTEYWNRKWIVQELGFARAIRMQFGEQYVDIGAEVDKHKHWKNVHNFLMWTIECGWDDAQGRGDPSEKWKVYLHLMTCIQIRLSASLCVQEIELDIPVERGKWTSLLAASRRLISSEPLDCIFSYQSMMHKTLWIPPSYTMTPRDLFTQFTLRVAQTTGSLTILDQACSQASDLPSWVPDFRVEPVSLMDYDQHPSALRAGVRYYLKDFAVLSVPGLEVDTIIAAPILLDLESYEGCSRVNYMYKTWDSAYSAALPGRGELSVRNTFWITLARSYSDLGTLEGNYVPFLQRLLYILRDVKLPPEDEATMISVFQRFANHFVLFFTASGRIGCATRKLAPPQPGDRILIIASAQTMICGRETEEHGKAFRLVNQCWIDGMMNGEVVRAKARRRFRKDLPLESVFEEILLV